MEAPGAAPPGGQEADRAGVTAGSDGGDAGEEVECRVCRGEAERGRPLFSPCMCAGSIKATHQVSLNRA